jgi:tellurite methyltransferase
MRDRSFFLSFVVWDKITSQDNNILLYSILRIERTPETQELPIMKTEEQRLHWDQKYQEEMASLTKPDPFFLSAYRQFIEDSFPEAGVVLDLAGGLGRHALWLTSRGWRVSVVDISEVAINRLRQTALQLNLRLELFALAANEYEFEPAKFDLIVLFYHLDRSLCEKIMSALKPGGFLICKTSLRWDSDKRSTSISLNPLERNEILSLVPDLSVMYHRERPVLDRGVVEFVGRMPENTPEL